MEKLMLSLGLLALTLHASAQTADSKVQNLGSNTAAQQTFDNRSISQKGSPYLLDEFQPGQMTTSRGTVLEDLDLRLDIFQNELQLKKSGKKEIIVDKRTVFEFYIENGGEKTTFRNIKGKYLEVVHDGPISILAEKRKSFSKAGLGDHYSQQDYDEYKDLNEVLYLATEGGELIEVKKSKKEFVKTFPVQQKEVKALIDEHKLKPSKREDLLRIVSFCDQLQS